MNLLNTIKRVSRWRRNITVLVLLIGLTAVGAFEHMKENRHTQKLQSIVNHQQKLLTQSKKQIETKSKQLSQSKQQVRKDQKQIQQLKTKVKQLSSRSLNSIGNMHIRKAVTMIATWYDSQGGINGTGITKIGTRPVNGLTVAVDPNVIPLHSKIYVTFKNGQSHEYIAQDTGSAIIGNRIDIYDSNPQECFSKGRQVVSVMILN